MDKETKTEKPELTKEELIILLNALGVASIVGKDSRLVADLIDKLKLIISSS